MKYLLNTNICLSLELTLVTNNVGEFQPVAGLRIENWADQVAE